MYEKTIHPTTDRPNHPRPTTLRKLTSWALAALVLLVTMGGLGLSGCAQSDAGASSMDFGDVKTETGKFIDYNNSIQLTAEQEAIKKEALSAIPAPCCSDNSAYTCCCPCNMAKATWGLANHLIANKGYDAQQVRAAAQDWHEFINPSGFSGNVCYTGGCGRAFNNNGCGGMNENNVVF